MTEQLPGIKRQGGCMCGNVRFETSGAPLRMTVCHCKWCQRRTGTAFGAEVVFRTEDIEMIGQTPAHHRHLSDQSGRWLEVYFCSNCGTNVGFTLELVPGVRTVPAGTYDNPDWIERSDISELHVFTRTRRNWGNPSPGAEVHDGYNRNG